MDSLSLEEREDLKEILELLKEYSKKDNKNENEEIINKLNTKLNDYKKGISFLIKSLYFEIYETKEFSLENIINITVYLKDIIHNNKNKLYLSDAFSFSKQIIQLIFNEKNFNINLNNQKVLLKLIVIFELLISDKINNNNYAEDLLKIILDNINLKKNEDFLKIIKYLIYFSSLIVSENIYSEEIFDNYYEPINKRIFELISNFMSQMPIDFNNDIICVIKMLFHSFNIILNKIKYTEMLEKSKEIGKKYFKKYGKYIYFFIQINPLLDEETKKLYEKQNPIIAFNIEEKKYNDLNAMKSHVFSFLAVLLKIMAEKDIEGEKFIKEKDLIKLSNKVCDLVFNSLTDIINNQQKYNFVKNYSINKDEEDGINLLLYQIFKFLREYLVIEQFKRKFSPNFHNFILEILFPMMMGKEEEIYLLINNDKLDKYYSNQFISNPNLYKNFRYSIFGLIEKICKNDYDIMSFILNFNIEMMNNIINNSEIPNYLGEYNTYFKYISNSYINRFNNTQKLDLSLLIIIILYKQIKDSYFKNYFREILVNNQKKFHLIQYPIIQVKLLIIYKCYFLELFETIIIPEFNEINVEYISDKIYNEFNENAVNYLINNITQDKNNYNQNLCKEACNAIITILDNKIKEEDDKENDNKKDNLIKYIFESLQKNFSVFISLIETINENSFYLLLEKIISLIKINEKNLLFDCINNLTQKFTKEFSKTNDKRNNSFIKQYFSIIKTLLKEENEEKNKINNFDKNDFLKFDKIFSPILENFEKYDFENEIISIAEYYLKYLDEIKNINILLLKKIGKIIDKEKIINQVSFNYIATLIEKIKNSISISQDDLINEIIIILKKSFSSKENKEEENDIFLNPYILMIHLILLKENLNEDIIKFIIEKCLEKKESNYKLNQIFLANICLCNIFYPDITFKILNLNSYLNTFRDLLNDYSKINFPNCIPSLDKCIICGLCSILTNIIWLNFFNTNQDKKLFFFYFLIIFINKQKTVLNKVLSVLSKKEICVSFVDQEDIFDEEIPQENIQFELNEKILFSLNKNDKILNNDEFKLFSQVYHSIKENDKFIYDKMFVNQFAKNIESFEKIFLDKNIKVLYDKKYYFIVRRIVHLKTNNNKLN